MNYYYYNDGRRRSSGSSPTSGSPTRGIVSLPLTPNAGGMLGLTNSGGSSGSAQNHSGSNTAAVGGGDYGTTGGLVQTPGAIQPPAPTQPKKGRVHWNAATSGDLPRNYSAAASLPTQKALGLSGTTSSGAGSGSSGSRAAIDPFSTAEDAEASFGAGAALGRGGAGPRVRINPATAGRARRSCCAAAAMPLRPPAARATSSLPVPPSRAPSTSLNAAAPAAARGAFSVRTTRARSS